MRKALLTLGCLGLVAAAGSRAAAQAPARPPAEPPCETARCVAQEDDDAGAALLWVPRTMLRIPRLALDTAMRTLVFGARADEEHKIVETIDEALFNDARTFGVLPSAFYETGFRPSIGVRVIHRDLAGKREGLRLRALFAGVGQQHYSLELKSGARFSGVELHAGAGYDQYESLRFYGLGNAEHADRLRGHPPRSAYDRDLAVSARYESEQGMGSLGLSTALSPTLELATLAQIRRRDLEVGDGEPSSGSPWVDEVFTTSSLTGLGKSATDGSVELVLAWDDRRSTHLKMPIDVAGTGWLLTGWLGAQTMLEGANGSFARLGGDVRRYFNLARGDRVLMLRLRSSWAIGHLRSIPFPDLSSLGGSQLLRGYPSGRFHDRGSVLATVEYRYPVQDNLASYVFIDAGRVLDTLEEATPRGFARSRVGFGAGMYLFSGAGLLLRGQLASSLDGGLFVHLLLGANDGDASTI